MATELKKEYEKKRRILSINFSIKEQCVLNKMMIDEEWENIAGFIKYKLFNEQEEVNYEKLLNSKKREDKLIVIPSLVEQLYRELSYINYRFKKELDELEKDCNDEKLLKKYIAKLDRYRTMVIKRTDEIVDDLQTIMEKYQINIPSRNEKDVRQMSDDELWEVAKDWDNTMTPEAREYARRQLERMRKEEN